MAGLARLLKQLKVDDWLGPMVDAARLSEPEGWGDPSLFVRPSAAGGVCPLELQFIQLGHRWPINSGLRALMDAGTQAHERITGDYLQTPAFVAGETRLTVYADGTPPHISYSYAPWGRVRPAAVPLGAVAWSGEADLLVRQPYTDVLNVGEIKKANSFRVKRLPPDTGEGPEDMARKMLRAEPKYMRQLARYVAEFRRHLGEELVSDLAFFHWEDANTQAFRIIWVRVEQWLIDDARANADVAEAATAEGRLVDFPFKKGSSTCVKCDRKRMCGLLREGDPETWTNVLSRMKTLNATRPTPPTTASTTLTGQPLSGTVGAR